MLVGGIDFGQVRDRHPLHMAVREGGIDQAAMACDQFAWPERPGMTIVPARRRSGGVYHFGHAKCIALLRVAARLTPPPPRASVRRGLKQRVLDMASGELLPHVAVGA